MADHFSGQIWIGGKVSPAVAEELVSEINRSNFSYDWGDRTVYLASVNELFNDCLGDSADSGHPILNFKDEKAHNGQFDGLETFCRKNGLSYTRCSEQYAEYPSEEVWWEPGMDETEYRYLDATESGVITIESIWPIKELLEAALSNSSSWHKQVKAALDKLNELDKSPPALPKFEVTA